ncbi:MAG TPA: alcohol dehydrogenase catalytic domain-containing protein [Thermoplasmata archaeon]|nr:alcohol dehydrogenase catalytic domain-containing protein [Thermoplasmata archaeon]
MKVGRLAEPGTVRLDERPDPVPGPGEITVTLAACGVCGTDLEKLRGNYRTAGVLGHEPVGRIARLGPDVSGLSEGQRVFVHHHVACGRCAVCARGDPTFCPTYSKTNLDPGGFAETFRVPAENVSRGAVLPLDPRIDWESGALLEPAGCAITAIRRVALAPQATVAVLGLGPVGILYARLAKALGARWVVGTEIAARRREVALEGGIDAALDPRRPEEIRTAVDRATDGDGVDLAVAATGHPSVVATATELVRRGGTVNLFGLPASGSRLDADLQQLYLRGIRVVPSYATVEPDIRDVHAMVVDGRLAVRDLVSHRFPLARIAEAFRVAGLPEESTKVVVTGAAF